MVSIKKNNADRKFLRRRNPMNIEKTKEFYKQIKVDDLCNCVYCQNYVRRIKLSYPSLADYLNHLGVDIAKPFETMELIARIKVWLRRTKKEKTSSEYRYKGIYVSLEKHIVKVNGEDLVLTLKEFELLCLLMKNQGTVFDRDQILRTIWGYEFDGENRTVDVHIRKLREKLGDCGDVIETVRGIGYKIGESL